MRQWLYDLRKGNLRRSVASFTELVEIDFAPLNLHKLCFCKKTHVFEPEAALLYQSLCGWRRAYQQLDVRALLVHDFPTSSSRKILNKGPVSLLQQDLSWLGCSFDPNTGVITQINTDLSINLNDASKGSFQHGLREMIRHKLLHNLQKKHPRWCGVDKADVARTSALVRKMAPTQYGRTALMRVLSNAHATPHHLWRQGVLATPACPYCSCEDADIHHYIYSCPRFLFLRQEWPEFILTTYNAWPACAQHCMIATKDLPREILQKWSQVQTAVAHLLETWMSFQRNPHDTLRITDVSHLVDCARQIPLPTVGECVLTQASCTVMPEKRLNLQWAKPVSRSAFTEWGGEDNDYHLFFSFWTKWTIEDFVGKTPFTTWMEVFLVFLQYGGRHAPFLAQCDTVGKALWKFRNLSEKLIHEAWYEEVEAPKFPDDSADIMWFRRLPSAKPFWASFGLPLKRDLRHVCEQLAAKQTAIAAERNTAFRYHLYSTAELLAVVTQNINILQAESLSKRWIPASRRKRNLLRWEQQAFELSSCKTVTCASAIPLETWHSMTAASIRQKLLPPFHARARFISFRKQFELYRANISERLHLQDVRPYDSPHICSPLWLRRHRCYFCALKFDFSSKSERFLRRCPDKNLLDSQLAQHWLDQITAALTMLDSIISRLARNDDAV